MNKKILNYIPLLLSFLVAFYIIVTRTRFLIDSDMSSEMILGSILAKEGKLLLTNSWFYSTEIRVLNSQLVFNILFHFMSSWYHIRLVGSFVIFAILALTLYRFANLSGLKKYYPYVLMCYFMPLCFDTLNFYLINLGYIVYVIYTFVALNLYLAYSNKYKREYIIISFVVAIIFSMCGSRPILHIYLPLLLTSIFVSVVKGKLAELKDIIFSICSIIGSIIGFMINKYILFTKFIIPGGFNVKIRPNFEGLIEVIKGIFTNNGFGENGIIGAILSVILVTLSLGISIYMVANYKNVNEKKLTICVFYLSGLFSVLMCFSLTNLPYAHRYILLSTIMSIPVLFTLEDSEFRCSKLLVTVIVFCYLILGTLTYNKCRYIDKTSELDYIGGELVANEYFNGYSTFWSSNVLTELTNGKVEVWCIGDRGSIPDDFKEIDSVYWWLQKREHAFSAPKNKVFILLDNSYVDKLLDLLWYLSEDNVFIQTKNYVVYGFESYDQMKTIMRLQ